MRFQHLRPTPSTHKKVAVLLALLTPAVALGEEPENPYRPIGSANALGNVLPVGGVHRTPVHGDRVPLVRLDAHSTAEVGVPGISPDRMLVSTTGLAAIGNVVDLDGWVPRVTRNQDISPLVIDASKSAPSPTSANKLAEVLGQPMVGLADHVGDLEPTALGTDSESSIRIGRSASSSIKIVPNALQVAPRSVSVGSSVGVGVSEAEPKPESPAIASRSPAQSVNNPEQNEPVGEPMLEDVTDSEALAAGESEGQMPEVAGTEGDDEDTLPELPRDGAAASDSTEMESSDSMADSESTSVAKPQADESATAPMVIRKLRLGNDSIDDSESGGGPGSVDKQSGKKLPVGENSISLSPLDPSIATKRVGDLDSKRADEYHSSSPGRTVPTSPQAVKSVKRPIEGDRITASGELILASGPTAAKLSLSPQTLRLKPMIQQTLKYYWDRPEDAAQRTHWGMMHSIMVFDRDTLIINQRQRFNAVAWMAGNNPCRNQTLFTRDEHGILPKTGVGLQGHQAQLLAIFGLINVPLDYPVYAAKQKYTVNDILLREMRDCKVNTELTFTLIGLAHYADSDSTWVAGDGQDWSVPRVIQEELAQPIVGAACGGTHRLMGFGHALRRRHAEGKPIDGQWARADQYIKDYVNYTWSLQNRDGSMSTAWYERPEDNGNMDRKIQTTGHMLEMLLTVTPDADLQSPQMLRTVNYMASTLYNERGHEWQIGPKGHALRSLAMYYQRVFGGSTPWRHETGARSANQPTNRSVR